MMYNNILKKKLALPSWLHASVHSFLKVRASNPQFVPQTNQNILPSWLHASVHSFLKVRAAAVCFVPRH